MFRNISEAWILMNNINKILFSDLEKRIEKDMGGTLWGISHPVNVLLNCKDDIIEGYSLIIKLKQRKQSAEKIIKDIDEVLK